MDINLNELNNRLLLEEISNDEKILNEYILKTKGYILVKLEENNIFPKKEYLLNQLHPFKLNFIIKNYELNKGENITVQSYINEDLLESLENVALTDEEISQHLLEGKRLSNKTILNINHINNYLTEIKDRLRLAEDKEYNDIKNILYNSFAKLSLEEVLTVDKEFLRENIHLIHHTNFLTKDSPLRDLYKETVLKDKKRSISNFYRYEFTPDEKDFFISLIDAKGGYPLTRRSYKEISRIKGVSSFITKYDYFKISANLDFTQFTNKEIDENIDFFHDAIISNLRNSHYNVLNDLLNIKMEADVFKKVITKDFFLKMLNKNISYHELLGYMEIDYNPELKEKIFYMVSSLLNIYTNNDINSSGVPVQDILSFNNIDRLLEKYDEFNIDGSMYSEELNTQIEEDRNKMFLEIFPSLLSNEKISSLIKYNNNEIRDPNIKYIINAYQKDKTKFASVNFYLTLSSLFSRTLLNSNFYRKNNYINEIYDLLNLVQDDIVKDKNTHLYIKRIINYNLKQADTENKGNNKERFKEYYTSLIKKMPLNLFSKKSKIQNDVNFTHNIFNYESLDLSKIDAVRLGSIYLFFPEVLGKILKDKSYVKEEFIGYIIQQMNNGSHEAKEFIKEYINLHLDTIQNNSILPDHLLSSPYQKEVYPYMNQTIEEKNFQNLIEISNNVALLDENISILKEKFSLSIEIEEEEEREKLRTLNIDKESLDILMRKINKFYTEDSDSTEINEVMSQASLSLLKLKRKTEELRKKYTFSFEFINNKMTELIDNKDFDTLLIMKDKYIYNADIFTDYVNSVPFNELMNLLDNKSFNKILLSSINYDNKTNITFKGFSKEENDALTYKLVDIFSEVNPKYKVFYFFDESSRSFIKDFAIKNFPIQVVYSYDFLPGEVGFKENNFIHENYTHKDLLTIFDNIENGEGFFSYTDVNADYTHFFRNVFFPNSNTKEENKRNLNNFIEFLELCKSRPKLYALMANSNIFSDGLEWGKDYRTDVEYEYKNSEEAINAFFDKHFDLDIVLEGLDLIKKDVNKNISSNAKKVNYKVALYTVTSVIHNTYYEDYSDELINRNIHRKYNSITSEEDTLKIMKYLYEEYPTHFIERHVIGKASNPVDFFNEHRESFDYSLDKIENLLMPNNNIISEYFRLDNAYGFEKNEQCVRLNGYMSNILNFLIEKKEIEAIKYLGHLIKQHESFDKEFSYRLIHIAYPNEVTTVMDKLVELDFIEKLEKTIFKLELENKLGEAKPKRKLRGKV